MHIIDWLFSGEREIGTPGPVREPEAWGANQIRTSKQDPHAGWRVKCLMRQEWLGDSLPLGVLVGEVVGAEARLRMAWSSAGGRKTRLRSQPGADKLPEFQAGKDFWRLSVFRWGGGRLT